MLICIIMQYFDFSLFSRDLHSSRVFPTNKRPRACSHTVNGENLTHPDVPYYSHLQPLLAAKTKVRIAATCFGAEYGSVCWWKTLAQKWNSSLENFLRENVLDGQATTAVTARQFSCVNANPNHAARRTTITGSNGREKRRKNFNGSVFKDTQLSRASPPTSLAYYAKTHSSQCYGRWRKSAAQRGRKSRWHCTESEVQREQRAANKARDR